MGRSFRITSASYPAYRLGSQLIFSAKC